MSDCTRNPILQIRLQLLQGGIELLAKGGGVKLFLDGAVKAFANAVGLWMPSYICFQELDEFLFSSLKKS